MKVPPPKEPRDASRESALSASPHSIRKILTTTDFSDHSRAGVQYAVGMAEKLNAAVEVVYVVEPAPRLGGMEAMVLARPDSEVDALARGQLARFAKQESKGSVCLTSEVCTGKPFHEITILARDRAADLIVIASHGHTGVKHLLLGSTAERVVRHALCPVLTVPVRATGGREGKITPFKLKRILVPIDFSDLSKDALPQAAFLAGQFDAELILLHVVEHLPVDRLLGLEPSAATVAATIKQAGGELDRIAANLGKSTGLRASAVVRDGTPFQEICDAAKALDADLVVLTTRGQTGLSHIVLGSTAERVVRHAPCPVLAVRELSRKTPTDQHPR